VDRSASTLRAASQHAVHRELDSIEGTSIRPDASDDPSDSSRSSEVALHHCARVNAGNCREWSNVGRNVEIGKRQPFDAGVVRRSANEVRRNMCRPKLFSEAFLFANLLWRNVDVYQLVAVHQHISGCVEYRTARSSYRVGVEVQGSRPLTPHCTVDELQLCRLREKRDGEQQ